MKDWRDPYGPGHPEWCPPSIGTDDEGHCDHWWDGEDPCCRCGDNTPNEEMT